MAADRAVRFAYDRGSDVLYVTFAADVPAITSEVDEGVLARFHPETMELVGITVLGLSRRASEQTVGVESLHGSLTVDPELASA